MLEKCLRIAQAYIFFPLYVVQFSSVVWRFRIYSYQLFDTQFPEFKFSVYGSSCRVYATDHRQGNSVAMEAGVYGS